MFDAVLAFALAVVEDEEVEAALGEEKLVGGVHDFLAAEVPDVDSNVGTVAGKLPVLDVDAFGFGFVGVEGVVS